MAIFGTVAVILTAMSFKESDKWLMLAVPQFMALVVFFVFAYFGRDEHTQEEQEDQLRFARAVSIAAALMCLAVGAEYVKEKGALFNINYFACIFQLSVFSIYTATRLFKEEKPSNFNFFQFSFITSVFLIGATVAISQIDFTDKSYMYLETDTNDSVKKMLDPFFVTSIVFYLLWLACQVFWVRRITSLIKISVVDE